MHPNEPVPGPIDGLHLPRRAWTVLERENITTLDQLKAVADRMERVIPGLGRKTARTIRAELARIASRANPRLYRVDWSLHGGVGTVGKNSPSVEDDPLFQRQDATFAESQNLQEELRHSPDLAREELNLMHDLIARMKSVLDRQSPP
jgi:hypothetical protein